MSLQCLSVLLHALQTYKRHTTIYSSTVADFCLVLTLGATKIEFARVKFPNKSEIVLFCSRLTISEKSNTLRAPNSAHIFFFITGRRHCCIATLSWQPKKMRMMSVTLLKFVNVFVECMTVYTSKLESLLSFYDWNMLLGAIRCKRKTFSIEILSKLNNSAHHF